MGQQSKQVGCPSKLTDELIAIAQADGAWIYISPDEISSVEYVPVAEVAE
ncbi:hypothetical protein AAA733_001632 [Providencia rettgeri]